MLIIRCLRPDKVNVGFESSSVIPVFPLTIAAKLVFPHVIGEAEEAGRNNPHFLLIEPYFSKSLYVYCNHTKFRLYFYRFIYFMILPFKVCFFNSSQSTFFTCYNLIFIFIISVKLFSDVSQHQADILEFLVLQMLSLYIVLCWPLEN